MIIGRENEQKQLEQLYESEYSEFVAIYGRRRVGKTFLVRETFNYRFAFQHTGIQGGDKKRQLAEFAQSLHNASSATCCVSPLTLTAVSGKIGTGTPVSDCCGTKSGR